MTQMLGQLGFNYIAEDDDRMKAQWETVRHPGLILHDTCKDPSNLSVYRSCWWPHSSGFLGDAGDINVQTEQWYDLPEISSGQTSSYYISGYARNASGAALSGVTLKLYLTSSDQLISSTTSASDGSYSLATGYGGQNHYIVAYLSGGGTQPDVEGTTVNTLTPGVPGA